MPIRILIADDHGIVAEGLKHLIEAQPDMQVVALVGDGREAVQQAREVQPDVVLMDLSWTFPCPSSTAPTPRARSSSATPSAA
jgi:DNA-binding NarL/FixJ family response regulator